MDGNECPLEEFLKSDDANTLSARLGLLEMFQHISENGWENTPSKWSHEANKENKIFEFIKGKWRIFFFKGEGNQIAICTSWLYKKTKKVDVASVNRAIEYKKQYELAIQNDELEIEESDDEDE